MKKIDEMNYSEFVGLINERNRPSGGIKTIQEVTINAHTNSNHKVLEIGSNTGFTSVNISLLTKAEVWGIDTIEESIDKSKAYAKAMGANNVYFVHGDALNLPFDDASFDLVWCSNVTSFIENKKQAITEYLRVLKPGGMIAIIPIYYRNVPPEKLLNEISAAINCTIKVWDKAFWINLFKKIGHEAHCELEIIYQKDYKYLDQSSRLDKYINNLLANNLTSDLRKPETFRAIEKRAKYFYSLFNENNSKYAGYSTMLMQKRTIADEEELFLSKEA